MADVAKVITIIGSSSESFAKAADAAVQEAGKTLRGITGADVVSMSAVVENDRITEYRTTVNIAFGIERGGGGGGEGSGGGGGETGGGGAPQWHPWSDFPSGPLKREIEQRYEDARPGNHHALEITVENPITGYRVIPPSG
jgi:dodecin